MNTVVETSSFGEGVQVFYGERGIEQFIYTNSESSVHILSVGVSFLHLNICLDILTNY